MGGPMIEILPAHGQCQMRLLWLGRHGPDHHDLRRAPTRPAYVDVALSEVHHDRVDPVVDSDLAAHRNYPNCRRHGATTVTQQEEQAMNNKTQVIHVAPIRKICITEDAARTLRQASLAMAPYETGGILIGVFSGGNPWITEVVEFRPDNPSVSSYEVPAGVTHPAIDAARAKDGRVGYLGEWHSHSNDIAATPLDHKTMVELASAPNAGEPVLIVSRPTAASFTLDAYVATREYLHHARLLETGPLQANEGEER